jgi:hypothetical protein
MAGNELGDALLDLPRCQAGGEIGDEDMGQFVQDRLVQLGV